MNAKDRGVSTETRTGLDAEGPLRRWSRRRREVAREEQAAAEARRAGTPQGSPDVRDSGDGASGPVVEEAEVLTDEDMPPLDSLGEDSDYSGFLSPGVTEGLRRRALRKLFTSAVFNVPDGLDDYDDDFTSFQALGDIVTSDMKHQAEMEAERAKQARAEAEPASGLRDESGRGEGEHLAHADEEATSMAEEDSSGTVPADSPAVTGSEPPEDVTGSEPPEDVAGEDAADSPENAGESSLG